MMASLEPQLMGVADKKRQLFKATLTALKSFKTKLKESFPLSSAGLIQFHKEERILLATEVIKAELTSKFKKTLENQKENSIAGKVEMLETVLDTILHAHLEKNKVIKNAARETMQRCVQKLTDKFRESLSNFQKSNPFAETEKLEQSFKVMKISATRSWEMMDKPGNSEFQTEFQEDFLNNLRQISMDIMEIHRNRLKSLDGKAQAQIFDMITKFSEELMAKKCEFDLNMNSKWNELAVDLQQKTEEDFVKKNPFPKEHSNHVNLNLKLTKLLADTRNTVNQIRSEELYPAAVHQCLASYLVTMEEKLFGVKFMSLGQLETLHGTTAKEALEQWNELRMEGDNAAEFELDLGVKITRALSLFQKQMEAVNLDTEQDAHELVGEFKTEYNARMKKHLEKLHKSQATELKKMLQEQLPVKGNQEFTVKYEGMLDKCLSRKLQKCIKILMEAETEVQTAAQRPKSNQQISYREAEGETIANQISKLPGQGSEIKYFVRMYRKNMELCRTKAGLNEIPMETYEELTTIQENALKKLCMLDNKSRQDTLALLHKLRLQLTESRKADDGSLKEDGRAKLKKIKAIIEEMKDEYKIKGLPLFLCRGNLDPVKKECIQRLEMEIKKIHLHEPLSPHKQVLQSWMDRQFYFY